MLTVPSTPVGPVTGGIIACILMVALGVYCLRQRCLSSRHCYPEQLGDSPLGADLLEEAGRETAGPGNQRALTINSRNNWGYNNQQGPSSIFSSISAVRLIYEIQRFFSSSTI